MGEVGKKIPHDSALGHVTGDAIYIDDIPFAKNELYVDFFGSPIAHGKIKSIDFQQALQIAGIVGIYGYQDIPGNNLFGPIFEDEYFLVEERCEYVGQPILILAGTNKKALQAAKHRIEIDIEPLPPVFTVQEARERQQFLGVPRTIQRGDIQSAFANAEHTIEGVFQSNGQEQFYLESQVALAYPGEEKEIKVLSSTQNPTEIQEVVAHMLGISFHEVICDCRRMGGAFGGKETQAAIPAMMASLVSYHTKRPARVAYTKDDDMKITGKRHPYQNDYKIAFTSVGKITGYRVDFYSNGGVSADLSTSVMERSMLHAENAYYIPNIEIRGTVCKTNFPSNTAFRGFGGPQGMAVIENAIEEIAMYLGKDSYEIRKLNCYGQHSENITPYGQIVHHSVLPEIFLKLEETANYQHRRAEIIEFNQSSKTHLKGISMTAMKFGISFTSAFLNQGNALVNVYKDGTVQVSTGGTEMGQGLNTKIKQIVADELGISQFHVKLMTTSTEKNNNTSPTAASAGTDLNGMAAADACRKIRANITEFAKHYFASEELGLGPEASTIQFVNDWVWDERNPEHRVSFAELVKKAYMARVSLGERGFYQTPSVEFNRETGKGHPFFYYTMGCATTEVLIDQFTGDLSIERVDVLIDIGESINPGIDLGQLVGGFVQGAGWLTNEELRYDTSGQLLSYSPTTYKIPNIQDIPRIFNVSTFDNPYHKINIRRSKAVGEPPLMMSLCVWTAVKQALSFVKQGHIPQLNIPATNEEILKRIHQQLDDTLPNRREKECEIPIIPSGDKTTLSVTSKVA